MISMNLNLLPSQARFQAAKIKLEKKVRFVLVIIVSLWIVVVGVVLVLNIISKIRVNVVQAQFDKAKKDYMAMSDSIVNSQRLKYKAKLVGEVLNERFEYGKAFEMVSKLFPEGIIIKDLDLTKKGLFNIKGEMMGKLNVDIIESVVSDISSGKNDKFLSAKILSLSVIDGLWSFEMEVNMR